MTDGSPDLGPQPSFATVIVAGVVLWFLVHLGAQVVKGVQDLIPSAVAAVIDLAGYREAMGR